jgi:hypothetical protein
VKTGSEDKRKVMILAGLGVVIAVLAVWELSSFFSSPAPRPIATNPAPQRNTVNARNAAEPAAERIAVNAGADVTLHLDKLAASEDVEYAGTGRNIFSASSEPVNIPKPLGNGREQAKGPVAPPIQTGPPPPPPIDLKYFGYSQGHDKSIRAFFVHGDDIFIAHTGDIVNHRYKVGAISPGSVEITDLSYNNTQTLPLIAN